MPPRISVIVPCYNERATIRSLLEAIRNQTLPVGQIEVLIADGRSTDGTREAIAEFARSHPELAVRIVDNPTRSIPSGLNRAIDASVGEVVVRLDAHSMPASDYLVSCLETLSRTEAANAGGVWEIRPSADTWMAGSIAAAASHPLGAGDARYRTGGPPGPVETVPFGAFPRDWLKRVGGYDEALLTNEDYELNVRLRAAGGIVWFDPSIRSVYFARATLGALARQYYRYGFWKARMLRRHPTSLRWRQAAAPLFVLATAALAGLAFAFPLAAAAMKLELLIYGLALSGAGLYKARAEGRWPFAMGVPLALATIHLAWGSGFWSGFVTDRRWGRNGSKYLQA